MFGIIKRIITLERRVMSQRAVIKAKDQEIFSLLDHKSGLMRRYRALQGKYAALRLECDGVTQDSVVGALRDLMDDIGGIEWATAEHAEIILRDLIARHYTRGQTALATMAGKV
ncbi:MAG: hypothetical protein ABIW76_13190 [Fibrobacteria bacterium]